MSPRAGEYDADSLRTAILDELARHDIQDRYWEHAGDNDRVPLDNLRVTLTATARRRGRSLPEWFDEMRRPREFGDDNTLIGFAKGHRPAQALQTL